MPASEAFHDELQNALHHLNDPAFRPGPELLRVLGIHSPAGEWAEPLRQAIQRLQPPPAAPADSRNHRLHQILHLRYSRELTQDAAAEQLHITARHLRREQSEAVQSLARLLWEQAEESQQRAAPPPLPADWSAQLRQELTALQRGAPGSTADVGETIQRVVELLSPVLQREAIRLEAAPHAPGMAVAAQPAGLRQLLVRAISEWARHLRGGVIQAAAQRQGEQVCIRLTGSPAPLDYLSADPLLRELLDEFSGEIDFDQQAEECRLSLRLAAAPPIRVLVVDDNEDLIHFYRRYVANTRYQIIPLTDGDLLFAAVEESRPDVILLDVMLPTADGWELLTHLRQHPLGRTVPIFVCSVIQEEELARALGATGYIRKPVGRRDLLGVLDRATGMGQQNVKSEA